jgi:hypothetical protein
MREQPIQDINDGKPRSEMDLFDLRNSLAYGRSILFSECMPQGIFVPLIARAILRCFISIGREIRLGGVQSLYLVVIAFCHGYCH